MADTVTDNTPPPLPYNAIADAISFFEHVKGIQAAPQAITAQEYYIARDFFKGTIHTLTLFTEMSKEEIEDSLEGLWEVSKEYAEREIERGR